MLRLSHSEEKTTVMPLELFLGASPTSCRALTDAMPGLLGYQVMLVAELSSADPGVASRK